MSTMVPGFGDSTASKGVHFFLAAPEECVSLCMEFVGFSGFLTFSGANKALFANAFRLKQAWNFYGYKRKLSYTFDEIVRQYNSCSNLSFEIKNNKSASATDGASNTSMQAQTRGPHSCKPCLTLTIPTVINRRFFSALGLELQRWKYQRPLAESYDDLMTRISVALELPLDEGKKKSRYLSKNTRQKWCLHFWRDQKPFHAQNYQFRVRDFARSIHSYLRRIQCSTRQLSADTCSVPCHDTASEFDEDPLEFPLVQLRNELHYFSGWLCNNTKNLALVPVQLPKIPTKLEFWPESLIQKPSWCLDGTAEITNRRNKKQSCIKNEGRVSLAAKVSVCRLPSCCCVINASSNTERCFGTSSECVAEDEMCKVTAVGCSICGANTSKVGWCRNFETSFSANRQFLVAGFDPLIGSLKGLKDEDSAHVNLERNLPQSRMADGISVHRSHRGNPPRIENYVRLVGLFSFAKHPGEAQPSCKTSRRVLNASTQLRGHPEAYAAFVTEENEQLTCVYGVVSPQCSRIELEHLPKTSKINQASSHASGFCAMDKKAEGLDCNHALSLSSALSTADRDVFSSSCECCKNPLLLEKNRRSRYTVGKIAVGTSRGRVMCTSVFLTNSGNTFSPACQFDAFLQSIQQRIKNNNRRASNAWVALSKQLRRVARGSNEDVCDSGTDEDNVDYDSLLQKLTLSDMRQLFLLSRPEAQTASYGDNVLSTHGFSSLEELYALTLSCGIEYQVVGRVRDSATAVHLINAADTERYPWQLGASSNSQEWLICHSFRNGLTIFHSQQKGASVLWNALVRIEGPTENMSLYLDQGVLAFTSRMYCSSFFLCLKAFAQNVVTSFATSGEALIEETVTWAPLFEVILPRDCQFEDFCAVYRTNSGPSLLRFLTPDMWAVVDNCSIRLVNVTRRGLEAKKPLTIKCLSVLNGHRARVYKCEFDGVRRLASIDCNEDVIVWDIWRRQKLFHFSLYYTPPELKLPLSSSAPRSDCFKEFDEQHYTNEESSSEISFQEEEYKKNCVFLQGLARMILVREETDARNSFIDLELRNLSESPSINSVALDRSVDLHNVLEFPPIDNSASGSDLLSIIGREENQRSSLTWSEMVSRQEEPFSATNLSSEASAAFQQPELQDVQGQYTGEVDMDYCRSILSAAVGFTEEELEREMLAQLDAFKRFTSRNLEDETIARILQEEEDEAGCQYLSASGGFKLLPDLSERAKPKTQNSLEAFPMEGLLSPPPSFYESGTNLSGSSSYLVPRYQSNPQTQNVWLLEITPNHLTVVYKLSFKWQCWTF